MEKANLFFSEVMRKHTLTEEQINTLQSWFFPGFYDENPNRQLMESTKDMMSAYTQWEARQQALAKEAEQKKPLPPMTDAEIDEIAKMF